MRVLLAIPLVQIQFKQHLVFLVSLTKLCSILICLLLLSARPRILETTYGPLYQAAGTTFTLQCTFTGPSSVVQIWSLNGVPLIPSQDSSLSLGADGSLTVLNAQEQYSGEYVCNVTTGYSFDSARVSVFIGSKLHCSVMLLHVAVHHMLFPLSMAAVLCSWLLLIHVELSP